MKKRLIPILIAVLAALAAAAWCIRTASDGDPVADSLRFSVPCGGVTVETAPWKAEDGTYYIFLPSCSSLSCLKPVPAGGLKFRLGEIPLTEDTDLSFLKTDTPYDLTVKDHRSEMRAALMFLQSSDVPALFVSTESGSMRRVDADKAHEEAAAVLFLDPSGGVVYAGSGRDSIHGRGNTTWSLDKKPYHLTLEKPQDLLGTGPSMHWILLANALDRTNLRNRIVFDAAEFAGLTNTPSCGYADVYLNGVYNGLYLLSEKPGISGGSPEQGTGAGGFLFEITNKPTDEDVTFSTKAHRTVRLREPKDCSDAQLETIREKVQEMETLIRRLPESGVWPEELDLDSFAARYLIDEFFINLDSDMASSFYYWDPGPAKMFAGPVWDYDLSCGSTANIWSTQSRYPDQLFAAGKYYYSRLYGTPAFREKVLSLYKNEFLPSFREYLKEDLPALRERIRAAEAMNDARWTGHASGPVSQTADGLTQFFLDRIRYLDDVWIREIPYCSVWLCDTDRTVVNHLSFPVASGAVSVPAPSDLGIGTGGVWYVSGTDRVFSVEDAEPGEVYLCPVSETELQNRPQVSADFGDGEQQSSGVLDYLKRVIRHEWQIVVPLACFLILLAVLVIYLIRESRFPKSGGRRR